VRISQLTKEEQALFEKNFNQDALIKIMIGEEIIHDCIQYKDYVLWYKESFIEEVEKQSPKTAVVHETSKVH
jgi:hypothetical protein